MATEERPSMPIHINNRLSTLMEELLNSLSRGLLKQKRRRKTTFELISGQIEFLESFS